MCSATNARAGVVVSVLTDISHDIKAALKGDEAIIRALQFDDYHGFQKSRLPASLLMALLKPRNLSESDVQIEIVSVEKDLKHEVHYHERASAYITILGKEFGFSDPCHGYCFLSNTWSAASAGQEFIIPAGVSHGFTVQPQGQLHFLSVQSPPIIDPHGQDVYFRLA